MAKVIRNCYVYRKNDRWYQHLPRRNDIGGVYDFEKQNAMPEDFNQPMEVGTPPKLWLVWPYRKTNSERQWIKEHLQDLFGELPTPGKMHIFKNTSNINAKLWHVKHLIEVRPISFPNGEPTADDVAFTELHADGRCVVDREANADYTSLKLFDGKAHFAPGYLTAFLRRRDKTFKDVYPDTVYNPSNITIVD